MGEITSSIAASTALSRASRRAARSPFPSQRCTPCKAAAVSRLDQEVGRIGRVRQGGLDGEDGMAAGQEQLVHEQFEEGRVVVPVPL